jgi:hypothetical protein
MASCHKQTGPHRVTVMRTSKLSQDSGCNVVIRSNLQPQTLQKAESLLRVTSHHTIHLWYGATRHCGLQMIPVLLHGRWRISTASMSIHDLYNIHQKYQDIKIKFTRHVRKCTKTQNNQLTFMFPKLLCPCYTKETAIHSAKVQTSRKIAIDDSRAWISIFDDKKIMSHIKCLMRI